MFLQATKGIISRVTGSGGGSTLLNDLVAWWPLEEPAGSDRLDSHGSLNLFEQIANVAQVTGKINNAAQFRTSGVDNRLQSPITTLPNSGDNSWSASLWVYPVTALTDSLFLGFVDSDAGSGDYNWVIRGDNVGWIGMRMRGVASGAYVQSTVTYQLNTWFHVYAEYNADTKQIGISVNNETLVTLGGGTATTLGGCAIHIGDWVGPSWEFYGKVDETAIWNRVLTEAERTELYNSGAGLTYVDLVDPSTLVTDLVAWYPLDELSGDRLDSHGGNDLTVSVLNDPSYAVGKQGNASSHSNNSGKRTLNTSNTFGMTGRDVSMACWIYPTVVNTSTNYIACHTDGPNVGDFEWVLQVNSNNIRFGLYNSATSEATLIHSQTLSVNTWYFIYAEYNNATNTLGVSIDNATMQTTGGPAVPNGIPAYLTIGSHPSNRYYYDGLIDEFAFWSRRLTPTERTLLYNSGAGLGYPNGGQSPFESWDWSIWGSGASITERVGMRFTVGANDYKVNTLGLYGFGNTPTENVRIHRWSDGALIAEADVPSTPNGAWASAPITEVTLSSGTDYIVSHRAGGTIRAVARNPADATYDSNLTTVGSYYSSDDNKPATSTGQAYLAARFEYV